MLFEAETDLAGEEPWFSDGTPGGTLRLRDILTGTGSSYPSGFMALGAVSTFFANDGVNGEELWRTDGTPGGTLLVRDIYTGSSGSYNGEAGRLGSLVIFGADDGVYGEETWASDGTAAGTRRLTDLDSGSYTDSYPYDFVTAGERVFFIAYDLEGNDALYFTDGQTVTLAIDPDDTGLSDLDDLTPAATGVFFSEQDGSAATNLWWSDGYTHTQVTHFTATDERVSLRDTQTVGDTLFFRVLRFGEWLRAVADQRRRRAQPGARYLPRPGEQQPE